MKSNETHNSDESEAESSSKSTAESASGSASAATSSEGAAPMIDPDDPIVIRRARIKQLCETGSRIGYSLFGLAIVLFFVALFSGFPKVLVYGVLVAMAVGSVVLLPAIVLGYGVKAADAEDRGEKFGY